MPAIPAITARSERSLGWRHPRTARRLDGDDTSRCRAGAYLDHLGDCPAPASKGPIRLRAGPVRALQTFRRAALSYGSLFPIGVMANLKLALRTLFKTPFVTAVAVLSLALGIGANAAIFSLFNQMLLRPLPVPQPNRLVNLEGSEPNGGS